MTLLPALFNKHSVSCGSHILKIHFFKNKVYINAMPKKGCVRQYLPKNF